MPRRRSYLLAAALMAVGTLCGLLLSRATVGQAQPRDDADAATAQERERQYESLARQVSDLEGHSKVLKAAIRLVSPAVVHIDAERPSRPAARPATATSSRRPVRA